MGVNGTSSRSTAELVSGNYFQVLGVVPAIGRLLTPNDNLVEGAEPYVVLTYDFWRRRFGGNPSILNRIIDVNSQPVSVVGVSQRGFSGFNHDSPSDFFIPMVMKPVITPTWNDLNRRNSIWLHIFGRLAPGVTPEHAAALMSVPYRQALRQDLKTTGRPQQFSLRYLKNTLSFTDARRGNAGFEKAFAKPLYVLFGMVSLLLVIACANVANLSIARAAARRREIAIRLSLGATRNSVLGMMLTEGLFIAVCGGVFACILSVWLVRALINFLPFQNMRAGIDPVPDLTVLTFTAVVTLFTASVFGLSPAVQGLRPAVGSPLKVESSVVSADISQIKTRRILVCIQVAFSLVLLYAAGLFGRSLHQLLSAYTGMDISQIVEFSPDPSLHKYSPDAARKFFLAAQQKLDRTPGVVSASAVSHPILANDDWQNTVHIEDYSPRSGEDMNPGANDLLPGFFSTLGIPLIAGRDFTVQDGPASHPVVIVNETFVKRFAKHGNALGLHLGYGGAGLMPFQIIGVVRDFKSGRDLREESKPYIFTPLLQSERPGELTWYIRASNSYTSQSVRNVMRSLDPSLPVYEWKTLSGQIDQTQFVDRLFAWLSCSFGILATLLAGVGLYGITSYAVTCRTKELAIRIALGAEHREVFGMVMGEVLMLIFAGLLVGTPLIYLTAKIASGEVYGIRPDDPIIIAIPVLLIVFVSTFAGFLPARRIAKMDPLKTLRYE